jgi:hypothetical protein
MVLLGDNWHAGVRPGGTVVTQQHRGHMGAAAALLLALRGDAAHRRRANKQKGQRLARM